MWRKKFRVPPACARCAEWLQVNEAVCQGCGACTVACPSGAMDLKGFIDQANHGGGGRDMPIEAKLN